MKILIVLGVMALVSLTTCSPDDYTRFDHIDIDEIIGNDRLFKSYILCFLDKGRCTPEGMDLKKALPNVINTACEGCTEWEKIRVAKLMKTAKVKFPENHQLLLDKYVKNDNMSVLENFIKQYAP